MAKSKELDFEKYFSREDKELIKMILNLALEEDIGTGDITTSATIDKASKAKATLLVKQDGIICGLPLIPMIFKQKTKNFKIKLNAKDADKVKKGQKVAEITANADILLMVERVLLNFLQRLSGIATLTNQYVDAVKPYPVKIMDTRKTTPLLRLLERYAVNIGGGSNHRFALYDQILIKDNHITMAGGIDKAIRKARQRKPGEMIEVEARTLNEVRQAMAFHPEIILLDNMSPKMLQQAVKLVRHKAELEASGGINLKNIRKIASTGIDRISIGALTHSAPALDLSLKINF